MRRQLHDEGKVACPLKLVIMSATLKVEDFKNCVGLTSFGKVF